MTYKTFIETINDSPILEQSDETVQKAVYDWFKYRYIGFSDADKFLGILRRNVKINYPMYLQKLRIEPGVSKYDWLVSEYRERQLKSNGNSSSETTRGNDTVTTTKNGTVNDTTTYGKTSKDVKSGGNTETNTQGTHTTTESPHVNRVSTESGGEQLWYGNTSMQATLPLSKSYTGIIEPTETSEGKKYYEKAYHYLPKSLNWDTATSQSQDGHREYHDTDHSVTSSFVYDDNNTGDITEVKGDSANPDIRNTVYNDETNTRTDGGADTKTQTNTDEGTQTNTYGNVNVNGTDGRTDREQVTGRNSDPATLLEKATEFIERSSAFMWFKEQIDSCFFPGYYTDDEEGSAFI